MNSNFIEALDNSYSKYFERQLSNKRFTHAEMLPLIDSITKEKHIKIKLLGYSIEKREIFSLEYGTGGTTILLWSQMHGDEPTATMALFDIFNFLKNKNEFNDYRKAIQENLKLIFVPMLNPDGAERIIRQNAAGIDLNRDAKRLQSPESKILMSLVEKHKPHFAFNLHDQDFRWAAGANKKLAAISLLAPVYDNAKSINESRSNAMKLVAELRNNFEKYLPQQIARYKDDFEPRSFGDLIAGKNVSTILIECGRDTKDSNKTFHRKINFMMLLSAFNKVVNNDFEKQSEAEYFDIPTNGNFMFDLILRNVTLALDKQECLVDIAINREEVYECGSRIAKMQSSIMDIGDLSSLNGLEEFDCTGLNYEEGKVSDSPLSDLSTLNDSKIKKMLADGILFVKISDDIKGTNFVNFHVNIINSSSSFSPRLELHTRANFNLCRENKIVKHVINGWLCAPNEFDRVKNGVVV